GGHQFFGTTDIQGPIPGTNKNYGQIVLLAEQTGAQTTVTAFGGPQYVDQNGPKHRVSNDQQDSFFSFVVWDTRDASYHLLRYKGPISDLLKPDFVKLTSDDSRLDDLTNTPVSQIWSWDPTGRWLTYTLLDARGRNQIWIYDAATNTSTKANDPDVSGLDI